MSARDASHAIHTTGANNPRLVSRANGVQTAAPALEQMLKAHSVYAPATLAISDHFHNKQSLRGGAWPFGNGWQTVEMTQREIVKHLTAGHALCVAALADDHRAETSFQSAQIIGIDFDHADYTTVITHQLVRDYAFLAYQTASHTDAAPRCRVLFQLDQPIDDPELYVTYVQRIRHRLEQFDSDGTTIACVQIFFGSTQPGRWTPRNEQFLPVYDVLDALPDAPAPAPGRTAQNVAITQTITTDDALTSAIEAALGVTGYQANGWSHAVRCPVRTHEHDDKAPAAYWNHEKRIFKCFKCAASDDSTQYRLAYNIAGYLGIRVATRAGTGLHNTTREALLKANREAMARTFDLIYMAGYEPGETITRAALTALGKPHGIGRKAIDATLEALEHLTICRGQAATVGDFPDGAISALSLTVPVLEVQHRNGKQRCKNSNAGRKAAIYAVPSESELAASLGVTELKGRDALAYCDLRTSRTYRTALTLCRLERANGQQIAQSTLAENVGVTSRQAVWKYLKKAGVKAIAHHRVVAELNAENVEIFDFKTHYKGVEVWLSTDGTDEPKHAPTKETALGLLKSHDLLFFCKRSANSYVLPDRESV